MEDIIRKAVELLDKKFGLPTEGVLAGGALANTINKMKFGGKCKINDIDIFMLDGIRNLEYVEKNSHTYRKDFIIPKTQQAFVRHMKENEYFNFIKKLETNDFVQIKTYEREGVFNNIRYVSNKDDFMIMLDSFDINCVQVGFNLSTGECFWTKNFKEYLDTKELKVTSPNSPSHTAVRIIKKRDEMEAKLDLDEEMGLLSLANMSRVIGFKRHWFAEKYFDKYKKYESELNKYFVLKHRVSKFYVDKNTGAIKYLSVNQKTINENEIEISSWRLYPKNWVFDDYSRGSVIPKIEPANIGENFKLDMTMDDFTYYWRNIRKDPTKSFFWHKFQNFYKSETYLKDFPVDKIEKYSEELDNLENMFDNCPCTNKSFADMSLRKQIVIMRWFKELYQKDSSIYYILKVHDVPFSPESLEELAHDASVLKIKYRRFIGKSRKDTNEKIKETKLFEKIDKSVYNFVTAIEF